jgi:hypothetical protein
MYETYRAIRLLINSDRSLLHIKVYHPEQVNYHRPYFDKKTIETFSEQLFVHYCAEKISEGVAVGLILQPFHGFYLGNPHKYWRK